MAKVRVNWQALIEYEAVVDVPDDSAELLRPGAVYGRASELLMNHQIPANCLGTDERIVHSIDLAE